MTAYRNMIGDLPTRGKELLVQLDERASTIGLECTLLLSVGSLVLVTPYERLKPPHPKATNPPHPSEDAKNYSLAAEGISKLEKTAFFGSPLWPYQSGGSWLRCNVDDPQVPADKWPERGAMVPLSKNEMCATIVNTLRHAFAHGNILVPEGEGEIEMFHFYAERRHHAPHCGFDPKCQESLKQAVRWREIAVSPRDLRLFLIAWCDWLRGQVPSLADSRPVRAEDSAEY